MKQYELFSEFKSMEYIDKYNNIEIFSSNYFKFNGLYLFPLNTLEFLDNIVPEYIGIKSEKTGVIKIFRMENISTNIYNETTRHLYFSDIYDSIKYELIF